MSLKSSSKSLSWPKSQLNLLNVEFQFKVSLRLFKWSLNAHDTRVTFLRLKFQSKGDLNGLKPLIGF